MKEIFSGCHLVLFLLGNTVFAAALSNQNDVSLDIPDNILDQLESINSESDLRRVAVVLSEKDYNELHQQGPGWIDKSPIRPLVYPDPSPSVGGTSNPDSGRDLETLRVLYGKMLGSGPGKPRTGDRVAGGGGGGGFALPSANVFQESSSNAVAEAMCAAISDCQPRPVCMQPLGDESTNQGAFFVPSCVRVLRCGGPCCSRRKSTVCLSKASKTKQYLMKEYSYNGLRSDGVPSFTFLRNFFRSFQEDERCQCATLARDEIRRREASANCA